MGLSTQTKKLNKKRTLDLVTAVDQALLASLRNENSSRPLSGFLSKYAVYSTRHSDPVDTPSTKLVKYNCIPTIYGYGNYNTLEMCASRILLCSSLLYMHFKYMLCVRFDTKCTHMSGYFCTLHAVQGHTISYFFVS